MFNSNNSLKDKISAIINIYLIGIVIAIIIICNISLAIKVSSKYKDLALIMARTLSNEVDGDKVEEWINTRTEDKEYEELKNSLDRLIDINDKVEYLFIQVWDDDKISYVADINKDHIYSPLMDSEPYVDSSAKYIDDVRNGNEFTYISISKEYGIKITANTPIYNRNGKYISSASSSIDISYMIKDWMMLNLYFLIFFIIILVIATKILRSKLDNYIFIPLKNLTSYAENYNFKNNNTASNIREQSILFNTGNEFEKLFRSFIKMEFNMAKNISLIKEKQWENDHDFMTKLYNKRMLNRNLSLFNSCNSIGVIFFDVNNLKYVNDKLGHNEGDKLICSVAKILEGYNKSDSIYSFRLGGDEFIMLLLNCSEREISKLLEILKWRFNNAIIDFDISCSVSIGTAYGENNFNLAELINLADISMYKNKMNIKKLNSEKSQFDNLKV